MSDLKKYCHYDHFEHRLIRDIKHLFYQSIDEDYYKPIGTKNAFTGNYIEYGSRGNKNKNLLPEEYLNMIRPCLSVMMNDH